jgi:hypothetical protein
MCPECGKLMEFPESWRVCRYCSFWICEKCIEVHVDYERLKGLGK